MAEVTAELIKELRERTNVGMSKCKEALTKASGNMDEAIEILRKEGMTSAVKKQGRETKEGLIAAAEAANAIALVEANAETDFVVKNSKFQTFLEDIASEAAKTSPASLEALMQQPFSKDLNMTLDQYRSTVVQALGENIQVRRLKVIPKTANHSFASYSHMGGKMVTFVDIEGASGEEELARSIAMHIAAAAPDYLSPDKVPQDVIEKEKEIARVQIVGKPDFVVNKILEGKISDFYKTACLLCQPHIRDESLTIEQYVAKRAKEKGSPLKVNSFLRWVVGENLPA